MNKEEFEKLINKIKSSIDETTSALLSEDLLAIISNYNSMYDSVTEKDEEIAKLKADKDELLKVNGKLFSKIGFDVEDENTSVTEENNNDEEELDVEDIIDEKGEIIDE